MWCVKNSYMGRPFLRSHVVITKTFKMSFKISNFELFWMIFTCDLHFDFNLHQLPHAKLFLFVNIIHSPDTWHIDLFLFHQPCSLHIWLCICSICWRTGRVEVTWISVWCTRTSQLQMVTGSTWRTSNSTFHLFYVIYYHLLHILQQCIIQKPKVDKSIIVWRNFVTGCWGLLLFSNI